MKVSAKLRLACAFVTLATISPPSASLAGTLKTVYAFPNPNPTPYLPWGGLTALGGVLYGMTYQGGAGGRGTVITIDPSTGSVTTLASFTGTNGASPYGGLTVAGGKLYGTTYFGGSNGVGNVFTVTPSTGTITSLYSFDGKSGQNPVGSLLYAGGKLYGASYEGGSAGFGAIFKLNAASGAETVLYSFTGGSTGAYPDGGLAEVGGILYGTTLSGGASGYGTIFSIDPATGKQNTLYSFMGGNDGGNPAASLIALNGTLYGTTEGALGTGINTNGGTVFEFVPSTGVETVLHDFVLNSSTDGSVPQAGLIARNGVLYGTTAIGGASGGGTVFAVDASTGAETVLTSLTSVPLAPVTLSGGKLYGATIGQNESGPQFGLETGGTLFELPLKGGSFTNLATFGGANPAHNATSALIDLNGTLIGTTAQGGPSASGAAFTVSTGTDTEATLANLGSGSLPYAGLIDVGGTLYGTTSSAGSGNGTVFSLDATTGAAETLYTFSGYKRGDMPKAGLLAESGTLYGTAQTGGASGGGTVFRVDAATGVESTIYSFTFDNDGGYPSSEVIKVGDLLYGTTIYGGTGNNFSGVVYSVNLKTHAEQVVHSFTGAGSPLTSDGAYPVAGLIDVGGTLYGAAEYGGTYTGSCTLQGCGIIYAIDPSSGDETILHSFSGGIDGAYPQGTLISAKGKLYGTTGGGGAFGEGALIEIDPASGAVTTLYSFTGITDGADPATALLLDDGVFYGTTNEGGPGNAGTVFTFTP